MSIGPLTPWEAKESWYANASDGRFGGGWLSLPIYTEGFNESEFAVGLENWHGSNPGFDMPGDPLQTLNFTLGANSPLWARGWERIPEEHIGVWKRGDILGVDMHLLAGMP